MTTNSRPLDDPFSVLDIEGERPHSGADPLADLLGGSPGADARAAAASTPEQASHTSSPDVLLDALHEEFVRAVRDPGRPAGGGAGWESARTPIGERMPESFDDMAAQAGEAHAWVLDVLDKRKSIDQMLDSFDSPDRSALLDAERPDEVLRLFAPELARSAQPAMPSITRRDHHTLSPDSPMPIERTRPAGEASE